MIYLELFYTFFKIGLFGFGGGYGMLSLIQGEVVTRYGWMTMQEFTDIVAISAGAGFSVGAKSDGTAVATGENTYHQCDVSDWNNLWLPVDNSQRLQN